jgi:hypothetical protein
MLRRKKNRNFIFNFAVPRLRQVEGVEQVLKDQDAVSANGKSPWRGSSGGNNHPGLWTSDIEQRIASHPCNAAW